jgi:two-component system sensor histidine kinase/response regulator
MTRPIMKDVKSVQEAHLTRVLVIDDEADFTAMVATMLAPAGYEILEANSGQVGIQLALTYEPDVILCDIMMADMDGFEVLERLHFYPPLRTVPFIYLTAMHERTYHRKGMSLGADDYLTKPFTRDELLEAISVRRRKQEAFASQAESRLEDTKKNLVKLVAHELRTPLVPLKLVSDVITMQLGTVPPGQLESFLDIVTTSTRRMSHLVQQAVFITEIEAGTLSYDSIQEDKAPAVIWDVLMSSVDLARDFATRSEEIPIRFKVYDQYRKINCVSFPLQHALAEIITNAINFSGNSEIVISQWFERGECWITIIDQGPGMAVDMIDHAFQAFGQINRDEQEQQGIGLGLSLANQIVEMHGGSVEMYSVQGEGTQVSIILPIN